MSSFSCLCGPTVHESVICAPINRVGCWRKKCERNNRGWVSKTSLDCTTFCEERPPYIPKPPLLTQGKYDAAESLYDQSIDIRVEVLGSEHTDATTLANWAGLCVKQVRML